MNPSFHDRLVWFLAGCTLSGLLFAGYVVATADSFTRSVAYQQDGSVLKLSVGYSKRLADRGILRRFGSGGGEHDRDLTEQTLTFPTKEEAKRGADRISRFASREE